MTIQDNKESLINAAVLPLREELEALKDELTSKDSMITELKDKLDEAKGTVNQSGRYIYLDSFASLTLRRGFLMSCL